MKRNSMGAATSKLSPHRASQTAEVMALFRSLETLQPARIRLFEDRLAQAFLRPSMRALMRAARMPVVRRAIVSVVDRRWPGARTSAIARTRLVDDAVIRAVREGAKQVLVLGAGFDSRAHRLRELARARVYEVDHPATQREKIVRLSRIVASRADAVVYVPVDFQTQELDIALRATRFDPNARTFVIWEGVTNYLSEVAVDQALRVLHRMLACGSEVLFTYVHRALLDGSIHFKGGEQILERVRRAGEPWTCGFDPVEMPAYLSARGLQLVEDLSADEYRARYFGAAARAMTGYAFYRAALARVVDDGARVSN
jgi:methyltransferase (TIGR00027 family)